MHPNPDLAHGQTSPTGVHFLAKSNILKENVELENVDKKRKKKDERK